jgi:diadenosine tetraphosphate (Ap4A) HIT family hydrolase
METVNQKACPFCAPDCTRIIQSNAHVVASDSFPVSPSHTLILPKRHVGSFFETDEAALLDLLSVP